MHSSVKIIEVIKEWNKVSSTEKDSAIVSRFLYQPVKPDCMEFWFVCSEWVFAWRFFRLVGVLSLKTNKTIDFSRNTRTHSYKGNAYCKRKRVNNLATFRVDFIVLNVIFEKECFQSKLRTISCGKFSVIEKRLERRFLKPLKANPFSYFPHSVPSSQSVCFVHFFFVLFSFWEGGELTIDRIIFK